MSIIFARILIFDAEHLMKIFNRKLREAVKYYFADFVRKENSSKIGIENLAMSLKLMEALFSGKDNFP